MLDRAESEADPLRGNLLVGYQLPKLYATATERHRSIEGLEAIFEGGMREFNPFGSAVVSTRTHAAGRRGRDAGHHLA